jgi:hypothetical protein
MTLNQYAAEHRMAILQDLKSGLPPREGAYDEATLKEARTKGAPQMGTTTYEPRSIQFEYIYPDPQSAPTVLTVRLQPPERIVFLPVPEWVVENVWQGEVDGSHHFESDAEAMVARYREGLTERNNPELFAARQALGKA